MTKCEKSRISLFSTFYVKSFLLQAFIEGKYGLPKVTAGLKGLRLLKTTKSGFVNFVKDGYRTLPDMADRIASTIVDSHWTYSSLNNLMFCQVIMS